MKRVLVWGLTNRRAGTEAVIENIVASLKGCDVAFDFLTFEEVPNYASITSGDNDVFILPNKRTNYLSYRKSIHAFFEQHANKYDAAWVNLNILNNVDVLRLACQYGIARRILHSHNAGNDGKLHQRILCRLNERDFDRYVTDRWACSTKAGECMFGDAPFTVVPNAIDMARFAFNERARIEVKEELGLGGSFVVGAVGRLSTQKNHVFLIDVMAELLKLRPDAKLVVVGEGELKPTLEELATKRGLADHVSFIGSRDDIPRLLSALDAYVMPSLFEGLPVSLLEAQANGLACVVSDSVTRDAAISDGIRFISLNSPVEWAQGLADVPEGRIPLNTAKAAPYDLSRLEVIASDLFCFEDR